LYGQLDVVEHSFLRPQKSLLQGNAWLVDDKLGMYKEAAPEVPEAGGVHPSHWQGSQKRSLPVSSATMKVWPGVPTVTSA